MQAAKLIVAFYYKRETAKRRTLRERALANVRIKEESPRLDLFPLLIERTQCLRCIRDKG